MRTMHIDVARGIGISLVVLGHVWEAPYLLRKYIYSFHIPLFFVLSGYLYNPSKYCNMTTMAYVSNKIRRRIVPYFALAITCMILKSGNYTEFKAIGKNIVGIIYSIGTKEWMPGSAPLWYLTALFSVEVMYFILTHKARYKDQLYLIGIIGVIGWLWSKYIQIRLPWNLDVAMTAILFFYFGRIVKDRMIDDVLHKYAIIIMPIAAVSMICCVATPSVYALGANKIGNPAISILGGISGALLIIKIAMLICEMKCAAILAYYGRNTLIVLGLNYIVHNWIDSALGNVMMLRMWIVNYMLQMLFYPIVIWLVGKVPPVKRVYYGEV